MNKRKLIKNKDCEKCGNPKIMYWCNNCEANFEDETCPACGDKAMLDKQYHDDCGATLVCTHKECKNPQTVDGEFCEKHYPRSKIVKDIQFEYDTALKWLWKDYKSELKPHTKKVELDNYLGGLELNGYDNVIWDAGFIRGLEVALRIIKNKNN